MVRKVSFVVRPNPALGALLSFAKASRARPSGLGERLEREVRLSLDGAAHALEVPLAMMRWLGRRGAARSAGHADPTGLAGEVAVAFDLRAAVVAALGQHPRVDGRAATDLYALRALVRTLRKTELLSLDDVALGRQPDGVRALLRVIEAACRETALADEGLVPKLFARVTPGAAAPAPTPEAPPSRAKVKGVRSEARAEPRKASASFGGLPDDATSAPVAPPVVLSARGLTADGEFFLDAARVKAWPCSAKVLTAARRTVLVRLHPDRAGEGSEAAFRSALKGYDELAAALAATPRVPRAPEPVRPTPPAAPKPARVASSPIGQWPPPPA